MANMEYRAPGEWDRLLESEKRIREGVHQRNAEETVEPERRKNLVDGLALAVAFLDQEVRKEAPEDSATHREREGLMDERFPHLDMSAKDALKFAADSVGVLTGKREDPCPNNSAA